MQSVMFLRRDILTSTEACDVARILVFVWCYRRYLQTTSNGDQQMMTDSREADRRFVCFVAIFYDAACRQVCSACTERGRPLSDESSTSFLSCIMSARSGAVPYEAPKKGIGAPPPL